jgi:hypothetical protein
VSSKPAAYSEEPEVQRALRWIRTAGCHFEHEGELEEELFGERGRLRDRGGEPELVRFCLACWRHHRRRGERAEREELERAEAWKASRAALAELERPFAGAEPELELAAFEGPEPEAP